MIEIPLTQDKVALIDDSDWEKVRRHSWCAWWSGARWYAQSRIDNNVVYMHVLILSPVEGHEIDHKSGNGLDNRRSNLRECTHAQNMANQTKHPNCSSRYKGVCWAKNRNKWIATIRHMYKQIHLGYFMCEEDAARAYNDAATRLFGEFASINSL